MRAHLLEPLPLARILRRVRGPRQARVLPRGVR
jgi:hypothetical protein